MHRIMKLLGSTNARGFFTTKEYEELITGHDDPVELIGGCWMEACCTPDLKIEEAKWVNKHLDKSSLPYGMVSGVDMMNDITETINFSKTLPRWRGFRVMLNYDENTPMKAIDKTLTKNPYEE